MMDRSGYIPVDSDLGIDLDDWLAELGNDILPQAESAGNDDTANQFLFLNNDYLNQLETCSVKMEEKLHQQAASESGVMVRLHRRMMVPESLCYHGNSAASSGAVLTQNNKTEAAGLGFILQNLPSASNGSVVNRVSQGNRSSAFSHMDLELARSQPQTSQDMGTQQVQEQKLKKKVLQPHVHPSIVLPNIQYNHREHQELYKLSLPTEFQSTQRAMSVAVQDQPPEFQPTQRAMSVAVQDQQPEFQSAQRAMSVAVQDQQQTRMWPTGINVYQQNHQLEMQEKQQQLAPYKQKVSTTFNQSSGMRSTGLQHQQKSMLKMVQHQHALKSFQQQEVASLPQKIQQQTSQSMQLHQLLGLQNQSNSLQESMQKRSQPSSVLLPQNAIIEQLKQLQQSQRNLCESVSEGRPTDDYHHVPSPVASVGSTSWAESANSADWHDHAYWELESLRETYLPDIAKFYKRARELYLQTPSVELAMKFEKTRTFIEKTVKFLKMPRSIIVHCSKDKFYCYLRLIKRYLISLHKTPVAEQHYGKQKQPTGSQSDSPQLQDQTNLNFQFCSVNPGLISTPAGLPQLSPQKGFPNLQPNKLNLVGSSTGSEAVSAWSSWQHVSRDQPPLSRPQKNVRMTSLQSGSKNVIEKRNSLEPLRHGEVKPLLSNKPSTQHASFSHMATMNASGPTTDTLAPSSTIPFLNSKQQPKHEMMLAKMPKKSVEGSRNELKKEKTSKQKMYEANEPNVAQLKCSTSAIHLQHASIGGQTECYPWSLLPSTNLSSGSPQTSHNSSPQNKSLSPSLSKAGTPLQSVASSFTIHSPPTPLTSSSLLVDPGKQYSGVSPLSAVETAANLQTPAGMLQIQSQAIFPNPFPTIGTSETSASPWIVEFNSKDNQQTNAKEPSVSCLVDMVESVSGKALDASAWEIGSVMSMIDRLAGETTSSEPGVTTCEDLAVDIMQGRKRAMHCGSPSPKRIKHNVSRTALLSVSPPFSQNEGLEHLHCQKPDLKSTATSKIRNHRTQCIATLLEEMKEINQNLMETVVDLVLDSANTKTSFGEGTTVRLSYIAVGIGGIRQQYASSVMLPILPLHLLVPADYPNSSPILLNTSPMDLSESGESESLSSRARTMFTLSLRQLEQPMSLGEMARAWEFCARMVLSEYAESMGGGSFNSVYGAWESCTSSS